MDRFVLVHARLEAHEQPWIISLLKNSTCHCFPSDTKKKSLHMKITKQKFLSKVTKFKTIDWFVLDILITLWIVLTIRPFKDN